MRLARIFVLIMVAALAACARTTPPAPVIYGGKTTQPPIQEASRTPHAETPRGPAQPTPGAPDKVTAQPGDTVYTLSRQYGISLRELIETNRLTPPYGLRPGQEIVLPRGERHKVREGETIYGIARQYGIDARDLVRINAIAPPYKIAGGQILKLPPRLPSQVASTAPGVATGTGTPAPSSSGKPGGSIGPVGSPAPSGAAQLPSSLPRLPDELPDPEPGQPSAAGPIPEATPTRGGAGFLWPVKGKVLVRFGAQGGGLHNDGINIAAPRGTPVHAAENGVVVYTGNELSGFGNLLILRHSDGWMTAYGHNDAFRVRRGDTVRRGQIIATVGQTGSVTTPQLHFEIRRGSDPVDPSRYLATSSTASRADPPNPG